MTNHIWSAVQFLLGEAVSRILALDVASFLFGGTMFQPFDYVLALFAPILGGVLGSFTNVLIWRLPRGESIAFPGSHCPVCNGAIKPYDNIPVLSYLILHGKCRHCGVKISIRYPLVELAMAILYTTVFFIYAPENYLAVAKYFLLLPALFALVWIDLEKYVIPDALTIYIAILGLFFTLLDGGFCALWSAFAGAATGGLLFIIIAFLGKKIFHKEALGEGDIYLIAACGFHTGFSGTLLTIFIAALLGTIVGAVVVAIRKIRDTHEENLSMIPFGPCIIVAMLIASNFGQILISWYLSLVML